MLPYKTSESKRKCRLMRTLITHEECQYRRGLAALCVGVVLILWWPRVGYGATPESSDGGEQEAVGIVDSQKDPNCLGILVKALEDPNASVRLRAIDGLGKLDNIRASLPLVKLAGIEADRSILRGIVVSLSSLGAARNESERKKDLVTRFMRDTPEDWSGMAEASDVITKLRGVCDISIAIDWECFEESARRIPVRLDYLAGRPVIAAWGEVITRMGPKEDTVVLLTPLLEIMPLEEGSEWHRKERQLSLIRNVRRKHASTADKSRVAMRRLQERIQRVPESTSFVKCVSEAAGLAKVKIEFDWRDLNRHGCYPTTPCEVPRRIARTVEDVLDNLQVGSGAKTIGISFVVESDGVVRIATRDTIAMRLAPHGGKHGRRKTRRNGVTP